MKIVILCGPTAVGKSALALQLANAWNAEIVSADSKQVWKELDIGTGKPTPQERQEIPHHLIDVVSPHEHFDVSRFLELADRAIADIAGRGKLPLIVGGTGLYIRSLLQGLCEAPPQDREIRAALSEEIEKKGLVFLYERLIKIDPSARAKIHPNDKTRILRSLEVYELTGHPLSYFVSKQKKGKPRYEAVQLGLNIEREELYQKINRRVDWMIANGWAEEVRELLKYYPSNAEAFHSIGYRILINHLRGEISLDDAVEEIKKQTRTFARRQLTWFRAYKEISWFSSFHSLQRGVKSI